MIEDIREVISKLIAAYEAEKAKSEILTGELEKCRGSMEDCRKRISELEKEIDSLRLAETMMATSGDRDEARRRIDRMIRTIDKCITLIES